MKQLVSADKSSGGTERLSLTGPDSLPTPMHSAVSFEDIMKKTVLHEPFLVASVPCQGITDLIIGLAGFNTVSRRKMAAFWSFKERKVGAFHHFFKVKRKLL